MNAHWRTVVALVSAAPLGLVAVGASGEDGFPEAAKAELRKDLPDAQPSAWAIGPLGADALPDVAALVDETSPRGPARIVAILHATPSGGFRLVARSLAILPHDRIAWSVRIGAGAVFLERQCAALCSLLRATQTFEFREVDGLFTLVAEEETNATSPGRNEDAYGRTVDFRTREVVHWRRSGNRREQVKTTFAPRAPITLAAFSFWDYEDLLPSEAKRFLDADFRLSP